MMGINKGKVIDEKRSGACLAGIEPDNLVALDNYIIPPLCWTKYLFSTTFSGFLKSKVISEKRLYTCSNHLSYSPIICFCWRGGTRTHDPAS